MSASSQAHSSSSSKTLKEDLEPAIKYDKSGAPLDDPSLKGISRYINGSTVRGRANVAKATMLAIAGFYIYTKFKKSGQSSSSK